MNAWQEDQFQILLQAKTEDDLFKALSHTAAELGFENFAYGVRSPLPVSAPKVIIVSNYSACWQDRYARNNYLSVDPTVAHGMRSALPLVWSDELFASCREFWEDAKSYGLRFGRAQSCHSPRGIVGMLTLARSHDKLSPTELVAYNLQMSWLSLLAHEGFSGLLLNKLIPDTNAPLTSRESEVMKWTAEGKTTSEVADIMNISDSTVNFHIQNAVSKLGCANKTAAAIRAVILRLI